MSFEEFLITEKYINKLRNINENDKYDYTDIYFQVISKYIFSKSIKINNDDSPIILADSYFSKFQLNEELPFVIKTDLDHELMSVQYINQKLINDKIKSIKKSYLEELKKEESFRTNLNDGEIFERNEMLLEQFKQEFGYDPFFQKSKKSDVLDVQLSDYDEDNEQDEKDNDIINKSKNKKKEEIIEKRNYNNVKNQKIKNDEEEDEGDDENVNLDNSLSNKSNKNENSQDGIPSLEILNNIIEVLNMDFNNISGDIIDHDNKNPYSFGKKEKCRKPRMTKKAKEEEYQQQIELASLLSNETSQKNIIKEYIKLASKLSEPNIKESENKTHLENGIKAALQLASFYDKGEKLISSGIKANMIYIYLIKKFNSPEAMFILGQNLLVGNYIVKNFLHGAKLIKVAAEKYKYKNAIAKLKSITRIDVIRPPPPINKSNDNKYIRDDDDYDDVDD